MAAYLHDLGKIGISDAILRKPAALTPETDAREAVGELASPQPAAGGGAF